MNDAELLRRLVSTTGNLSAQVPALFKARQEGGDLGAAVFGAQALGLEALGLGQRPAVVARPAEEEASAAPSLSAVGALGLGAAGVAAIAKGRAIGKALLVGAGVLGVKAWGEGKAQGATAVGWIPALDQPQMSVALFPSTPQWYGEIAGHLRAAHAAINQPGGSTPGSNARATVLRHSDALLDIAENGDVSPQVAKQAQESQSLIRAALQFGGVEKNWEAERAAIEQMLIRAAYVEALAQGTDAALAAGKAAELGSNVSALWGVAAKSEQERLDWDFEPSQLLTGELSPGGYVKKAAGRVADAVRDAVGDVSPSTKVIGVAVAGGLLLAALAWRRK